MVTRSPGWAWRNVGAAQWPSGRGDRRGPGGARSADATDDGGGGVGSDCPASRRQSGRRPGMDRQRSCWWPCGPAGSSAIGSARDVFLRWPWIWCGAAASCPSRPAARSPVGLRRTGTAPRPRGGRGRDLVPDGAAPAGSSSPEALAAAPLAAACVCQSGTGSLAHFRYWYGKRPSGDIQSPQLTNFVRRRVPEELSVERVQHLPRRAGVAPARALSELGDWVAGRPWRVRSRTQSAGGDVSD
jgi:hypothetical protein